MGALPCTQCSLGVSVRRLALALALLLSLGLVTAPPASSAYDPSDSGVFNTPPPWGEKQEPWRIVRHVMDTLRAVPDAQAGQPKPEVLLTSFLLDGSARIDQMIAACRRGISIRVIIDKGIETKGSKRLIAALNGDNRVDRDGDGIVDPPKTGPCGEGDPVPRARASSIEDPIVEGDGEPLPKLSDAAARSSVAAELATDASWGGDQSYVTQCKGACRGRKGSMHAKFYAFSKSGSHNNVVIISSSNLNAGGALKGWNDGYTMKEVPNTFAMYEQVHDEMGRDRPVANAYRTVTEGPYTSRVFPMDTGNRANDPAFADLNKVRCRSAFGKTKLFISMFYWQGTRGGYMADRVLKMARNGCQVSIIMGAPSREIAKRLRTAARAGKIRLWDSRVFNKRRELIVRTHHKYTLIRGTYDGDNSTHLVMTGSANWGHGSLNKSDDNTLNIELASAYNQYLRNWNEVRRHSKRVGR